MARPIPEQITTFLQGKRLAVAGVSRDPRQAANAIFRRLRAAGYTTFAVNPRAESVEGEPCHPDLASIAGPLDGVVIAAPPSAGLDLVSQCSARGVPRVWFHKSLGAGSVSSEAIAEAHRRGIACIVGGCPLMFCAPVDPFHKCMRWWMLWRRRITTQG